MAEALASTSCRPFSKPNSDYTCSRITSPVCSPGRILVPLRSAGIVQKQGGEGRADIVPFTLSSKGDCPPAATISVELRFRMYLLPRPLHRSLECLYLEYRIFGRLQGSFVRQYLCYFWLIECWSPKSLDVESRSSRGNHDTSCSLRKIPSNLVARIFSSATEISPSIPMLGSCSIRASDVLS
jgi:hypothetical protein